jgi:hypothetical protein
VQRLIACVFIALLAGVAGPRVVGPRNHAAGTPFVFEPPEGFVAAKDTKVTETEGVLAWVPEAAEKREFDGSISDRKALSTRVVLTHSKKEMSVEEADLAKLVTEMPKAFEGACTWSHRRHEMRTRADGARVGLIEGDCDRDVDLSAFGLPSQPVKMRKLQLMFPDDEGTSIVTTSYPTDQATRWEPVFEATISKARGVATRVPAPAPWAHAVWAMAGAVLGWLATAIVARKESGPPTPATRRERDEKSTRRERDAKAKKRNEQTDEDDAEEDDAEEAAS